ncbi:MAG: hypothetical protein J6M64_09345 [Oscillospiraceae bacterium]|nr:hypothetical protein [Oscillospiraceae bacterium]
MALTGLGWRSLDAVEAVAAVHAVKDRKELYRIAEEAMHPEARRLALLKLGDKEKCLMLPGGTYLRSFAGEW